MPWTQFNNHARATGRSAECGSAHRENGSVIYGKARAWPREFTSGKIEHKAVWMLKPAHIRLDEFTELDFHIDAVGIFSNFYTRDGGMRIAQSGTRVFLGNKRGRSQADQ